MPDIAKINAVAIADIEKLDSILAANIEKVNGLVFSTAPAFTGLLDTYTGAVAAYSVRQLKTGVTIAMRVRRDTAGGTGDDDQADVAFDTSFTNPIISLDSAVSNFSTTSNATNLGEFLNATGYTDVDSLGTVADGFCDTWYDQSGAGNDAEQTAFGSQPQIFDSASPTDLITENGKPALQFVADQFDLTGFTNAASNYSCAIVNKNGASNSFNFDTQSGRLIIDGRGAAKGAYYDGAWKGTSHGGLAQVLNMFFLVSPSSGETYQNGSAVNTGLTYTQTAIGGTVILGADYGSPSTAVAGPYQEFVLWPSDESTKRSGIQTNINNHFAIGNLPNPTSGLLFDYPDAAAAYSVRQLANTAPLSMRVRRDTAGGTGDDDEADVLFDFTLTDPTISLDSRINNPSAGVASTTLGEFLNATGYTDVDSLGTVADGFCDTWYDQSGNGIDAEQTVPGNQPQIFDSASPTDLIQENGKPSVQFDGTNDNLQTSSSSWSTAGDLAYFMVMKTTTTSPQEIWNTRGGTRSFNASLTSTFNHAVYSTSSETSIAGTATLFQCLQTLNKDGSNMSQYLDGTLTNSDSSAINANTASAVAGIGARSSFPTRYLNGSFQEIIHYPVKQTSNRTGIESNIDTYFSIT